MTNLSAHRAYDILNGAGCPVVLLCEHASNELPQRWGWPDEDSWIVDTHWAWDIGAKDLCVELNKSSGCSAILANFSRLLIDANRTLQSTTLVRSRADGRRIALNQGLSAADVLARIEGYWTPYHRAASALVASKADAVVIGVHSFTPEYEGEKRSLEIGVLFDQDEDFGVWACEQFQALGLKVALNEPYSGLNGLMYSPQKHASKHARKTIELEIRQDLVGDAAWRREWLPAFTKFIEDSATWAR